MAHAVVAALLLVSAAAYAQGGDAERCTSITGNPDLAIQHCTRAIESGRLSGETLAQMHYSRAIEWAAKNDYDRAIADYDAAIRLNPRYADAYFNRANSWGLKGDSDRAIADYDAALKLNPRDANAHAARAVELMVKGDYPGAIAGYDTALKLEPKSAGSMLGRGRARLYSGDYERAADDLLRSFRTDPNLYTAAWLYLARKRGKVADAEERLDEDTRGHRDGAWPTPIVMLYMGRTDADSVMAAATDINARRQRDQRCEANFYVGEWRLLQGETDRALALFKEAQSGCPRDFIEYEGAAFELRRLQR
jgi:lipoprotein NlpI